MNKMLINSLVENSSKTYSKTPIQETLSKLVDSRLNEDNTTSDIATYQDLIRKVLTRVEVSSVLKYITTVIPAKGSSGKLPLISFKMTGKNSNNTNVTDTVVVLVVADETTFTVGGFVSSTANVGIGEVLYKESKKLLVKVTTGSFVDGDSLDNTSSFTSAKTTLTSQFSNTVGVGGILEDYSGDYVTTDGEVESDANEIQMIIKQLDFQTKSKKIKTDLTMEFIQDTINVYGVLGKEKILSAMATAIVQEIESKIFTFAKTIATQQPDLTLTTSYGTQSGLSHVYSDIYSRINMSIGRIGTNTNIGTGFFTIASSNVVAALQTKYTVKPLVGVSKEDEINSKLVGVLPNGCILVEDGYAISDYMVTGLVGPKGYDNGAIIYTPYNIDFVTTVDSSTLHEVVGITNQYDFKRSPLDTKSGNGSSDMLEMTNVIFDNLTNSL